MSRLGDDDFGLLTTFGTGPECAAAFEIFVAEQMQADQISSLTKPCNSRYMPPMKNEEQTWQAPDGAPLYTMGLVERAAGVTKANLRVWLNRNVIQLRDGDAKPVARGFPNFFTLRSVLMITVTAELVRLGVAPKLAGEAAAHWMSTGVVEGQVGAPARREAGGLYPSPMMTYLVMPADGVPTANGDPCDLVGVAPNDAAAHHRLFAGLFARGRPSARIILLNSIDQRVRQACQEALLGRGEVSQPDWDRVVQGILATEKP